MLLGIIDRVEGFSYLRGSNNHFNNGRDTRSHHYYINAIQWGWDILVLLKCIQETITCLWPECKVRYSRFRCLRLLLFDHFLHRLVELCQQRKWDEWTHPCCCCCWGGGCWPTFSVLLSACSLDIFLGGSLFWFLLNKIEFSQIVFMWENEQSV